MKMFNSTFSTKCPLKCNTLWILNAFDKCWEINISCLKIKDLSTYLVIRYRPKHYIIIMKCLRGITICQNKLSPFL